MEFRTCEEYVLNQLADREEKLEQKDETIELLELSYARLQTKCDELETRLSTLTQNIQKVKEIMDIEDTITSAGDPLFKSNENLIFEQFHPEEYKFLKDFFNLG